MQKEHIDIAVVTAVHNKLDDACLTSLREAIGKTALNVRVIVIDNNSDRMDVQGQVMEQMPEATVILRNDNRGFGFASNRGAHEVEADYYFFLNPDTKVHDETVFDKLHSFMRAYPKVGIAAPLVRYYDGRVQETYRRFPRWFTPLARRTRFANTKRGQLHSKEFMMEGVDHAKARMVDWIQGSAFMIDGKLFHEIGGFDERYFMYYEDVDLCRSCWELGRPVYHLPHAEVSHEYGQGSADKKGVVNSVMSNKLARAHISSWIKYTMKWR